MRKSDLAGIVPRETVGALRDFLDLVVHWNRRINLLGSNEAGELWHRHVLDSAQLFPLAPADAQTWVDLGAGAGFPGLVCAIMAKHGRRSTAFTLIESDTRKAAFLREAARRLGVAMEVVDSRIESVVLPPQDVISARALAPLDQLLGYAEPFCHPQSRLLIPKGRKVDSELTLARRHWHSRVVRVPSRTDPDGTILQISEVRRRP